MKPRIRRENSYTLLCQMWFCRGLGRLAMGDSPRHAYILWKWTVSEKGELK
jgi:hypothetical protein